MNRPLPLVRPTKEEIEQLQPFEQLPLSRVHLVKTKAQVQRALAAIRAAKYVGFDTETKPVWEKAGRPNGPHLIQFATLNDAFLIRVTPYAPVAFLKDVIESEEIVKVGFGLKSDRGALMRKLGIRLGATVELAHVVRKLGYRQAVGVKAAVAIVLRRHLKKSKSATCSDWAHPHLTATQKQYAADDAHAAIRVFHALGAPLPTANLPTSVALTVQEKSSFTRTHNAGL